MMNPFRGWKNINQRVLFELKNLTWQRFKEKNGVLKVNQGENAQTKRKKMGHPNCTFGLWGC